MFQHFGAKDICHTKKETAPWIGIDYGATVTIHMVKIYNRQDCSGCTQRTKNVHVHISDELPTSSEKMFSGGTFLGRFYGPATTGQIIRISGRKYQSLLIQNIQGNAPASGRYVVIQIYNRGAQSILNFAEVQAFGNVIVILTSQELRMLSSVTLDCQVTKIVMNSGSQL